MILPEAPMRPWHGSESRRLFERLDDGAGGRLQVFKRRFKFQCRYWWHRKHLHAVTTHIDTLGLRPHLVNDPELSVRCLRPYLWSGLKAQARAAALKAHLDWLSGMLPALQLAALYREGRLVLRQWSSGEQGLALVLQPGRALGREGELELHLTLDGVSAVRASFSILPGSALLQRQDGPVMVIGNLQGAAGGRDLIRQLSGAIEKTRPSHLLLNALQGLAQGWGLAGLAGVSTQGHVYAGYASLRKRVGICYDDLWQELGASERVSATHWALPMQWHEKSLEDVPSKKRSELRRRNTLRSETLAACRAAAQQLSQAA